MREVNTLSIDSALGPRPILKIARWTMQPCEIVTEVDVVSMELEFPGETIMIRRTVTVSAYRRLRHR
jgi:hypothetical protein